MLDKRKFYINGQWVDPSNKNDFEVINPSDESVCAIISLGSQEDTDAAVSAARAALPMWSSTSKEERVALLERLYAIYQRRMDEMAEVISIEMGAPIDFSKAAQAPSGTNAIEDFLNQLKKFEFEEQLDDSDNQLRKLLPVKSWHRELLRLRYAVTTNGGEVLTKANEQ